MMRANGIYGDSPARVVVAHENITERKMAEEAARDLARMDGLTGLYNRREMERILQEEVARHHRYKGSLSLILVDIDHFKAVNDTHGHAAGDEVLKFVAHMLQSSIRAVDYIARYGGEEIAIILPETSAQDALVLAERLREGIAAHPFVVQRGFDDATIIPVTVSIGLASLPAEITTPSSLFEEADKALYSAKRTGRNKAILAENATGEA